jgi:tetratricopeptide (TPR) repeat protein
MNKNLILQAENYELNQDYKKAINCYYEILKYNKNDLNTLNKIGSCFFNLGNYEMAIKNFEKILPLLNQPIPDLLNNIGEIKECINDINYLHINDCVGISETTIDLIDDIPKGTKFGWDNKNFCWVYYLNNNVEPTYYSKKMIILL